MLEKYYRINQAVGISIQILQNGSVQISACMVVVENDRLSFSEKIVDVADIDGLKKHFPAKSFAAINLSGKGILQKQIDRAEEINQHNFSNILPNGNIDDFYVQNFIAADRSFVSVIRKIEADKWVNQLKDLGFIPLQFSLAAFPVSHIISQLNVYESPFVFNGHVIEFDEHANWTAYHYAETKLAPFPIKAESEVIDEKLLIAYAAAFQLLLASKLDPVKASLSNLETEYTQIINKKQLQTKGAVILCIFFILLLVNFLLFSWLNASNAKLARMVSRTVQSNEDLQSMNDHLKQKEALLRDMGWEGGNNKSVLVDQLASLLPAEVTWSGISVDPVDLSQSRVQKALIFASRQIKVTGISEKIIPVNEWIARIKTKQWVKNIQMDSYTYNSELNTGQFTVTINY